MGAPFRVREATREDAPAMARIWTASFGERAERHYSGVQLAALVPAEPDAEVIPDAEFERGDRHAVVAEREGAVVGWGSVDVAAGVLAATFVDPDHADEGVGQAVVERLEAEARDAGLDALTVPASLNAVGFYAALGYERVGEIDVGGEEGPVVPGVEMRKPLA